MTGARAWVVAAAALACLAWGSAGARAAPCGNDAADFPAWLTAFKRQAQNDGIQASVLDAALGDVSYDRQVIKLDRNQKAFRLTLDQFMARRAPPSFVAKARKAMGADAALLASIQAQYGVQPEVLVAIWGMETGFGANSGKMPIFRSLATLSFDCRRPDFFTEELTAALRIVQRGDKTPGEMRGAWAGEIGQTQFLARNYLRYAVDFDGDGRRDLIASKADVLASTANFLREHGWQAGAGYGPGEPNHGVFADWNRAAVYQQALALFAARIAN